MLGGNAVSSAAALELAHRIAAATGARLMAQGSNGRLARGQGRVPVDRVPYVVDTAVKALAGTRQMILVGARKPVTFFAYPGQAAAPRCRRTPTCTSWRAPTRTRPRPWRGWPTSSARRARRCPTLARARPPPAAR